MPSVKEGDHPTMDELLTDNASLLKEITIDGTDRCLHDTVLNAFKVG